MQKKIVFVGDARPASKVHDRIQAFKRLGYNLSVVDYYSQKIRTSKVTFLSRVLHKLRIPSDQNKVNWQIRKLVDDGYDLFWFEKPNNIKPSTIKYLKEKNAKIIAISEDDMCNGINNSRYFDLNIKNFDKIITTKSHNVPELIMKKAKSVKFIHKTYNPNRFHADAKQYPIYDVTFIGTFEHHRNKMLQGLAQRGLTVNIWGNGWGSTSQKGMKIHPPVYGSEFRKIVALSKINLVFLRKSARDQHTAKTFEIPACGGFSLMEDTVEHRYYMERFQCCDFFDPSSIQDLYGKINFYLQNGDLRETKQKNTCRFRQDKNFHVDYSLGKLLEDMSFD